MENLDDLMKAFELFKERALLLHDVSQRFDKRLLLQIHDDFDREPREAEGKCNFEIRSSFTDPSDSGGAACSVPLEKLNPISFNKLKFGKVHSDRVVYGMLCAEAKRICGIMTLLEDDNGLAVRLAIYNSASSGEDIKRLYPRGAKVAVKEPYFKIASDGGLLIRVDNLTNFVNLVSEKGKRTENLLYHVDVEDVRQKGNRCFREQNWDAAAEHYTRCIDAALLQLKERCRNDNNNINACLLHAYSNRAETRLQVKEFDLALEDSNKALGIDPNNFKALYRKGRSLLGLRQYAAACKCLEKCDKASPGHREIQDALRQAKTFYDQNRNGKYDISGYLLGRASSPPEVADFVGSVEIKMTKDGRGRGLYATRATRAGQLLLVSNAVGVAYQCAFTTMASCEDLVDLVSAVVSAARKSQRLLRQIYSLQDSPTPGSLDVPAIDLFKTDVQMSAGQEVQDTNLLVDVNRVRNIVGLNSFGGAIERFVSKSKINEGKRKFRALWLLPSFINHSCLPNSNWLDVGTAMFIYASKPIERGEEITIPYFDVLVPLPQRQAEFENWGFNCKCRRCILEHSFRTSLDPVNTLMFEQLHDKASELVAGMSRQPLSDLDLPEAAEFVRLSVMAEEIIMSSPVLETEEEKRWIRASFVPAYILSTMMDRSFLSLLSGQKLREAIRSTDPADLRNLEMAAGELITFRLLMGNENESLITRQASEHAREACISVFGSHSEDVLKALVLKYSS